MEELESGLQIQTLTEGTGETTATENDYLRLHFKLSNLSDGELQDSRDLEENPIVVPSFNAIPLPGMAEALGQMKEGETAKVVVPPALAFGEQGLPGQVAPNETFIYELELIEVIPESDTDRRAEIDAEQQRLAEEAQKEMEARQAEMREAFEKVATENLAASQDFLNEQKEVDGVQSTESGLLYQVVENGGEGVTPDEWDEVEVHYRGTLPDGTEFDSSYSRGEPTSFPLNRVIPGWTEGVALMNVGDKYRFFIPPELAYGEMGTQGGPIGPNQALVFDVELLNITENEPPEKVIPTPIDE
ncbi:MAG: FKBP-type peptidyl-prolyl cis-trans isomerase [Pseudomonadota bacterium]